MSRKKNHMFHPNKDYKPLVKQQKLKNNSDLRLRKENYCKMNFDWFF